MHLRDDQVQLYPNLGWTNKGGLLLVVGKMVSTKQNALKLFTSVSYSFRNLEQHTSEDNSDI